jgi:hypothetical protein
MEKDMFDVDQRGNLRVLPTKKAEQSQALINHSRSFVGSLI